MKKINLVKFNLDIQSNYQSNNISKKTKQNGTFSQDMKYT